MKNLGLNELLNCDTMVLDEALNLINMKKRIQQVKNLHPYEVHYTKTSGYFTNVDDETLDSGKRKIRRCSEESLWEALADWYLDSNKNCTLRELFPKWLEWKKTPTNHDNIRRILCSWKAYYENEPLSQTILDKPLSMTKSIQLREWTESVIKKNHPVDKKKFSRIFSIVNQCYEYAADEDRNIVSENTWQKARKKINRDLICQTPLPSDESQVFTDNERIMLKQMIHEDMERYQKQPTSAGLQILFLFETGLRIGECCGLKWTDIRNNRLYIQRQANNSGIKDWTKSSSGYRDIPLTTQARNILGEIKEYNRSHNFNAEWIFQSNNPKYDYRLSYNAADRKLRKLCTRMDTVLKSPHKCRKTCISALLDSPDINSRTAQRFSGHRDIATTLTYYSYERKNKEQQAEAIEKALAI